MGWVLNDSHVNARERIPLRERFAPSRRAEMDFLGVQEPTVEQRVEQPMPEQPVQNVAPVDNSRTVTSTYSIYNGREHS
jgi:hypothetical protein